MTLTERAREIVRGVGPGLAVNQWKEGDEEFVRMKLADLLREAMAEVCVYCKEKVPTEQLGEHSFVHDFKEHPLLGRGIVYCLASPITKLFKE